MAPRLIPRLPRLPVFLQRRSTEEFRPPPQGAPVRAAVERVRGQSPEAAAGLGVSLGDYWSSRQGTAAALRALDQAWGGSFYDVPEEAVMDRDAADAALGGDQLVIDVQTHYISNRPDRAARTPHVIVTAQTVAGDRFKGLYELALKQSQVGYSFAEYLRCVFLESETAVAVLSSAPGVEGKDKTRMVTNAEMIGTRELIDRLAGTGRLINHCVAHPNVQADIELMEHWRDWCSPAGWKVYTMYGAEGAGMMKWDARPWMLDDEESGEPFLQQVYNTGVRVVCAHKGLSGGAATGWDGPSSPRDIGPAAKAFPSIDFLVYHSGYEPREGDQEEGPYSDEVAHIGTNRLIKSLKDSGIGTGGNVYAELGSTWYLIMAHPREAAHVMGKLLATLGEDNIVWGTDSIWYGPAQPLIDAFRAFRIPEEYCERYGYPQLTPTAKEKILGLNAAHVYGLDPEKVRAAVRSDDLAWVKAALAEFDTQGTPVKV